MDSIPLRSDTYRLIPSHFPPIQLFENLLDADELEIAYQIEGLSNDRLREQAGDIALVAPEDRVIGPGSTAIMAAFTHRGIASRFTDGSYGVYYAGLSLDTALAESSFSRARFLSATNEPPQTLTMRCYQCRAEGEVVDVRGMPELHNPDSFTAAQAIGAELRQQNHLGILYDSVRHRGGECLAALRPRLLQAPAQQTGHYQFHWDGETISAILELRAIRAEN